RGDIGPQRSACARLAGNLGWDHGADLARERVVSRGGDAAWHAHDRVHVSAVGILYGHVDLAGDAGGAGGIWAANVVAGGVASTRITPPRGTERGLSSI